jgi:cell division protein FtsI/penicillin-binding protein 2
VALSFLMRCSRADSRLVQLFLVLAVLLLVGLAYACFIQLGFNRQFERVASAQQQDVTPTLPRRGRILDAYGRIVAFSMTTYEAWVYPTLVQTGDKVLAVASLIAKTTGRDLTSVTQQLETMTHAYVFAPNLDYVSGQALGNAVHNAGLDYCITVEPQETRFYPFGDTFGSAPRYYLWVDA